MFACKVKGELNTKSLDLGPLNPSVHSFVVLNLVA